MEGRLPREYSVPWWVLKGAFVANRDSRAGKKGQACEAYWPISMLHHPSPILEDIVMWMRGILAEGEKSPYRKSRLDVTFDCSLECHGRDEW